MTTLPRITIGLDLGDCRSHYCVLDQAGQVTDRSTVRTTRAGLREVCGRYHWARVVLEVGTHSPWVSRLVAEFEHEVVVANARKVKAVCAATQKSDRVDAGWRDRSSWLPTSGWPPWQPAIRWWSA